MIDFLKPLFHGVPVRVFVIKPVVNALDVPYLGDLVMKK